MKRRLFDPWGLALLVAFTLGVTVLAVYGFLTFGGGLGGIMQLP